LTVALGGRLAARTLGELWAPLVAQVQQQRPGWLTLDLRQVTYCDGAGASLVATLRANQEARGGQFELVLDDRAIADLIELFGRAEAVASDPATRRRTGFVEQVGVGTRALVHGTLAQVAFVGEVTLALGAALLNPRRIRWRTVLRTAEVAGTDALPIVLLLGAMIGVILSVQSLPQLRWFGADLFVANLVGLSLLRELGPLLTAVILAGRTGSAFAAEIGTMQVNEEVDALTTMGLDPVRFLIVPRLLAAIVITPLLSAFMILAGLVGSMMVMWSFGFPPITYINRVVMVAGYSDLVGGLVKALVFGILVSGVGCLRGLQTGGGPEAVGEATTSAVVSGIVLITIADFVFSVIYFALGL